MLNRKFVPPDGNTAHETHVGALKLVVKKREILFHERAPAPSIYEVLDGAVMVYRMLADGRRQIVDLALPGSLCGFSRDNAHEHTGEALVVSTVAAYERATMTTPGSLGAHLLRKMEEKICALAEHVVVLGRQTTEERLANFLVQCAQAWRRQGDDKAAVFQIPMTRVEIGDYLGMSLETVSRGIADLERRGLLRTGSRQGEMQVMDLAALSQARRRPSLRRKHAPEN